MVASQNPSPYKCGACGLVGHNRRTCVAKPPGIPALDYRIGKEVKCGACGKRGHNKRTCPERPRVINEIKCGECGRVGHNRRTCWAWGPLTCPSAARAAGLPGPLLPGQTADLVPGCGWIVREPPTTPPSSPRSSCRQGFPIFGTFGDFWCDEEYCTEEATEIADDLPLSIIQKPLVPPNQAMPLSLLMLAMDLGVRENVRKSPHSPCFAEIIAQPPNSHGREYAIQRGSPEVAPHPALRHLAFTPQGAVMRTIPGNLHAVRGERGTWWYPDEEEMHGDDYDWPLLNTDDIDKMVEWYQFLRHGWSGWQAPRTH